MYILECDVSANQSIKKFWKLLSQKINSVETNFECNDTKNWVKRFNWNLLQINNNNQIKNQVTSALKACLRRNTDETGLFKDNMDDGNSKKILSVSLFYSDITHEKFYEDDLNGKRCRITKK